ncbi:hypothetical protein [Micromonospora sp. KC723]|uniref:hypothetical protein n=1 Tax=Micromonospora sp. KC723 TaxID=2530381 RepID=UPI00104E8176|nr:hypothetical protein [Micromonospora sp. KC723]TDB73806.1 hypothetical protein E1165_16215 [Micromonospora sp. KC723]
MDQSRAMFVERCAVPEVDKSRWVAHYLLQWTTPDRSEARYEITAHGLRLVIDVDQPAWRDVDGGLRVSHLQTGLFSGPVGSTVGTRRHVDGLTVVTAQPERRLFLPTGGRVEVEMRASADPTVMLAFWLVGSEESPSYPAAFLSPAGG